MTINNVTSIDMLKDGNEMAFEDESLENYGTNKERSEVDQINQDNVYNSSRFVRNRSDQPSMQVILEESRVENETTIDN